MALSGPVCPECGSTAVLADASEVYGPKFAGKLNVWRCPQYPECDCFVRAAAGPVPTPIGTMANALLRKLRKQVYDTLVAPTLKRGKRQSVSLNTSTMTEDECRRLLTEHYAAREN